MKAIITRGLPGSGKSTYRKQFEAGIVTVCSADDFHTLADGTYAFDPKKTSEAHGYCLRKFANTLIHGAGGILVVPIEQIVL